MTEYLLINQIDIFKQRHHEFKFKTQLHISCVYQIFVWHTDLNQSFLMRQLTCCLYHKYI